MRLTLNILEATALLVAIETEQVALTLEMTKLRKLNKLDDLTAVACRHADLAAVERRLKGALEDETRSRPEVIL